MRLGTQADASRAVGRPIYVFMAILFIVVAVAGFTPSSFAIVTGARPTPPLIVHLHAAAMSAWLVLLLTQTLLIASGRTETHKALGVASFILGPAMFLIMSALVLRGFFGLLNPQTAPPASALGTALAFQIFIMARAAVLFGVFFFWAIALRRSSPEAHKRMMIFATFVVIDAAIARIAWLPGSFVANGGIQGAFLTGYDATHIYQLLLLVPVFLYEIVRFRRVHWVYVLGVGLFLSSAVCAHFTWNSLAWRDAVSRLVGA